MAGDAGLALLRLHDAWVGGATLWTDNANGYLQTRDGGTLYLVALHHAEPRGRFPHEVVDGRLPLAARRCSPREFLGWAHVGDVQDLEGA